MAAPPVPEPLRVPAMHTDERRRNALDVASLRGGLAIVTGGASGIGLGLLTRCAQEGMLPVVLDVNEKALRAAGPALRRAGAADVMTLKCDAGDRAAVFAAAAAIQERYPGKPVSFLSANAGFGAPSVLDTKETMWRRSADVLLFGVAWLMQAFKKQLLSQKPAPCCIVNTSSFAGLLPGNAIYGACKAAVISITESVYQEYQARKADHIKVHVLCPGVISTNISKVATMMLKGKTRAERRMLVPFVALERSGHSPATCAARVFEAVADGGFYIIVDDADSPVNIDAFRALRDHQDRRLAGEPPGRGSGPGATTSSSKYQRLQNELLAEMEKKGGKL